MNLDPQMIQQIMGMGAQNPEQIELARKQKMIDAMRQRSMNFTGEPVQAGRGVTVAPIGQGIAALAQGFAAHKMQGQADIERRGLNTRQQDAQGKYMDALTMALRRPMPGSNTKMLPPDGMEDQ